MSNETKEQKLIKEFMKKFELSERDCSKILSVDERSIYRWVKGLNRPSEIYISFMYVLVDHKCYKSIYDLIKKSIMYGGFGFLLNYLCLDYGENHDYGTEKK